MSTLRQIDDVRTINELESQLDNALGSIEWIEREIKSARAAVAIENPFQLMIALSEAQSKIREAMHFAIAAQEHAIIEIKREAQRIG